MNMFFTLTSPESKRLIGKAVAKMPIVSETMARGGKILISPGSTTAYAAEGLTGNKLDISRFPCGCIAFGRTCRTAESRDGAILIEKTVVSTMDAKDKRGSANEIASGLGNNDLMIKGANAIDPQGNAGFLLGNSAGGLLLAFMPAHSVKGCPIVVPVGLEKLVASVPEALKAVRGINGYDVSFGRGCGYHMLSDGIIVTELEAVNILTGCTAVHVASGGIGTSAGSVVLSASGEEGNIQELASLIKSIKGEPPIEEWKMQCKDCEKHCNYPLKQK
jgi:hypothetical protein